MDFTSPCVEVISFRAPHRPECDLRLREGVEIERVHALGRREPTHVVEVLGEQRADLGAGEIVDANLHDHELEVCTV